MIFLYRTHVKRINFTPRQNMEDRMIGGKFEVANSPDFSDAITIYTIERNPKEGINTINLDNTLSRRYIRYLSSDEGNGNVSEIEFYQ